MFSQNYYTIQAGDLQGIFVKIQKIFSPTQKRSFYVTLSILLLGS